MLTKKPQMLQFGSLFAFAFVFACHTLSVDAAPFLYPDTAPWSTHRCSTYSGLASAVCINTMSYPNFNAIFMHNEENFMPVVVGGGDIRRYNGHFPCGVPPWARTNQYVDDRGRYDAYFSDMPDRTVLGNTDASREDDRYAFSVVNAHRPPTLQWDNRGTIIDLQITEERVCYLNAAALPAYLFPAGQGAVDPSYPAVNQYGDGFIGDATVRYDGVFSVGWTVSRVLNSPKRNDGDDNSNVYYLSLTLCGKDFNCGSHGRCVSYLAGHTHSTQSDAYFWYARLMRFSDVMLNADWRNVVQSQYNVRGCICNDEYYGRLCDQACPLGDDLCSGHGTCDSGRGRTVDDMAASKNCICSTGCRCRDNYSGDRCEFVAQSSKFVSLIQTYDVCCPMWAGTDCMTMKNQITGEVCRPNGQGGCLKSSDCRQGRDVMDCGYNLFVQENSRCGEDYVQQWFQNEPDHAKYVDGDYTLSLADLTRTSLGSGMCSNHPVDTTNKAAICWCNPTPVTAEDAASAGDARGVRYGRRGFYGSKCQTRTCTQMRIPVVPIDAASLASSVLYVPLVTVSVQCNGRGAKSLVNDNHWKSYADATVCLDTFEYGFNTPGACRQCDDGWGAYAGYAASDLVGTAFALSNGMQTGLCTQQTMHSAGGAVCGGYGTPTRGAAVPLCPRPTDTKVVQFPVKPDNPNFIFWMDCSVPNRTLTPILSCSCPAIYTVLIADSGICQRSCASISTNSPAVAFTKLNTSANSVASIASTRCSGNGLCRPILDRDAPDGFNSACMCNAGWNGYDCSVRDWRFFDPGTPAEFDRLHVSPAPSLCGPHGMSVVLPAGAGDARNPDFAYFVDQIASLGQPGGGLMSSVLAYSNNACMCNSDGVTLGYAVPSIISVASSNMPFTCSRICTSAELMGVPHDSATSVSCSGPAQGACVSDPSGLSVDMVCLCQLGFSGSNCEQTRPLHDELGQACGGTDRGIIIYAPDTFNRVQMCICTSPYIVDAKSGLCTFLCPTGANDAVCSGVQNGSAGFNAATLNDCVCVCNPGFAGASCNATTTESNVGQSGLFYACTGHGWPHADGYCVCAAGFVGAACEMDLASRRCGEGQPYIDNYSASIVLSGATQIDAVAASRGMARCGAISMVKMWMVYSLLILLQPGTAYNSFDYIRDNYGSAIDLLYLDDGAVGSFDLAAHLVAYRSQYVSALPPDSVVPSARTSRTPGFMQNYYFDTAHSALGVNNACVRGADVWR